jgi:hypothetical protein
MLSAGAGPQLQGWERSVDVGSESSGWTSFPASYILIGGSGYTYGEGHEVFVTSGTNPAPAQLSVTLGNP